MCCHVWDVGDIFLKRVFFKVYTCFSMINGWKRYIDIKNNNIRYGIEMECRIVIDWNGRIEGEMELGVKSNEIGEI